MGVHSFDSHAQEVAGLQCVIAIVVVCWVSEHEASLQVVLIDVHLWTNICGRLDLLALIVPPQGGQGVRTHREDHACVVPLLRLLKLNDDRRDCRRETKHFYTEEINYFVPPSNINP